MARLASCGPSGKAVREMANGRAPNSPVGSNRNERLQDEASLTKSGMGYGQLARVKGASTPEHDIEVQYPWPPAATATPAELPLDRFQSREHFRRSQTALYDRDGVGEVTSCPAVCRVKKDWGCVEQAELFIEPGNGCLNHACWTAMPPMRPVRPDRDSVELRCACH